VRTPTAPIYAPDFPPDIEWLNAPFVRLGTLLGRHVPLVWFWDYTSLNSIRALPYLQEWHRRYADAGLSVIGVHSPQFGFGRAPYNVTSAVARLEIEFPVALDSDFETWKLYGNEVWPSLYVWDRRGVLRHYHHAEGGYLETEEAIQELLGEIEGELRMPEPMSPLRRTDEPGALVLPPTPHTYINEDRSGRAVETGDRLATAYSGATAAAVLDGAGHVHVSIDGETVAMLKLHGPDLYELYDSRRAEAHDLALEFLAPATAYMFSFAPGPA
jgi:AhpC/TSA family